MSRLRLYAQLCVPLALLRLRRGQAAGGGRGDGQPVWRASGSRRPPAAALLGPKGRSGRGRPIFQGTWRQRRGGGRGGGIGGKGSGSSRHGCGGAASRDLRCRGPQRHWSIDLYDGGRRGCSADGGGVHQQRCGGRKQV